MTKETAGPATRLVARIKDGDDSAIEEVWRLYVRRLRGAARPVVTGLAPGAGDEEDVAQSAYHAFCEAAAAGRLPPIGTLDELGRVLLAFARRKAVDCVRHERSARRGGGATVVHNAQAVECACDGACPHTEALELQDALDNLSQTLALIDDPTLTALARLRMKGMTNQEIADQLGCTVRTIQRKLHVLERLWRCLSS